MALSGAWLAANGTVVPEVGALKWGTGINPIHSTRAGAGRGTADNPSPNVVPDSLTDQEDDGYGYATEDSSNQLWGDGYQTGTEDRPDWGETGQDQLARAATATNYPSWKQSGRVIRAINKGATALLTSKTAQEDGAQGWLNKETSYVENAGISDPSQYIIQTSMVQRDKVREGSQSSGTASVFDAPIESRIPGMKVKTYISADSPRHADMLPREQTEMIRPFTYRTAGTGYPTNMLPNEMHLRSPMNRVPNPDPYGGPDVDGTDSGYVDEDYTW